MAGFLRGCWDVVCPQGHVDRVGGITRNHDCESCGTKAVDEGSARVKCGNCGTVDSVNGVTEMHSCSNCRAEVRC
jgi:hypothetical protein